VALWGPIVERKSAPIAVEIDLEPRFTGSPMTASSSSRRLEQAPLHIAIDDGYQNDEAGMQWLRRIELPEIARVVGDENEIVFARITHDLPVLPTGPADMRDVLGFMTGFIGDGDRARPALAGGQGCG
jgi:hypothetical protein